MSDVCAPAGRPAKLVVSIVVFHSDLELLADVLHSLQAAVDAASSSSALRCETEIVNNAGDDETRLEGWLKAWQTGSPTPLTVRLIHAGTNLGYGAGNNLSIRRHADADLHLVLNPDVLLETDTLVHAVAFLHGHPEVGLVIPRVFGFDGEQQFLCKRNPTLADMFLRGFMRGRLRAALGRREALYEMRDCDYDAVIRHVSYPTGCFMFFRGGPLRSIGGFDERFFLHYEDADIGRRLLRVADSAYVPEVSVRHKWSRDTHRSWKMRWITIKSGLLYFRIWGGIA